MNKQKSLADYGPLEKYVKHESDRSRLVIPVIRNMGGQLVYKLTAKESAALDELIATGSILTAVTPAGAVYTVAMPERLPAMFETFQADPEPVTLHYVVNTMFVTLQRGYNLHQCFCLMNIIRQAVPGIASINIADLASTAENVTVFTVTFKASCAYAPDTAAYKRIKALAGMFCQRITPRRAAPGKPNSATITTDDGQITVQQASLF